MIHDCILLASCAPDERSPVRIFVGSEDGQWRAERVFVWSIEQVRDPSRAYEIHLMKRLPGFDDRHWLTGFTNYRFVVPHLAEAQGRAIYNDVDQIYLCDPAELFDSEMGDHGYCSINDRDTSVMLMDAEKMASVWPLDATRRERRKRIERRAAEIPGLWGQLDAAWNARDTEATSGRSKLVHFTTIHTQPWMPFPGRFSYQHNPVGALWHDLERSADEADFQLFSEQHPSIDYRRLLDRLAGREVPQPVLSSEEREDLESALVESRASTVLEARLGYTDSATVSEREGRRIVRYDPSAGPSSKRPIERFDAVVFSGGLEHVPDSDLPWLIETLFWFARDLLYVSIREDVDHPDGARAGSSRDRFFWSELFGKAAARHPRVDWRVVAARGKDNKRRICWSRGRPSRPAPSVWVLDDGKAGHLDQSVALADALGWSYETRRFRSNRLIKLGSRILGSSLLSVKRGRSDPLEPPWPDLVISTGRRGVPIARWIARQSRGRTRVVQIGRRGGYVVDGFDLVVTCSHFRLLPHHRRLEILTPICGVTDAALAEATRLHPGFRDDGAEGPVVVVVGGSSGHHELDAEAARRLGEDVLRLAGDRRIVAITSPRTGTDATDALADALGDRVELHRWKEGAADNPYLACLAAAGTLVITGDSESMLSDATAVGVPVYVYPMREKPLTAKVRYREWVRARAYARPMKRRKGTVRPQKGLEAFCSRLLARGFVRIRRDVGQLHRDLAERGIARPFGEPLSSSPRAPHREIDEVAHRVREIMGLAVSSRVDANTPVRRAP
jgi:mitochondrial fission protein ELM1